MVDDYLKINVLTRQETGTPYTMSSGYRDQYIIKKTFPSREEALRFLEEKAK